MRSGKLVGFIVVVAVLGGGLSAALAETVYVNGTTGNDAWDGRCAVWDGATCGPKATIQAGIDAAVGGDEVVLADCTYAGAGNKNLDFLGKAITVRSASDDPALCIIDCEGDGRGFYFHTDEGPGSVVAALTITRGYETFGAGVQCAGSSPTLTHCAFSGNSAGRAGGGVYCHTSTATLSNCTFDGNRATYGGGAFCDGGSPTLTDCTFRENWAATGGGVCCFHSSPMLSNCTLSGNSGGEGGGVWGISSNPMLSGCTLRENAAEYGGGVWGLNGSSTLVNCVLTGNSAVYLAGGVGGQSGGNSTLVNCTLSGNSAPYAGGVYAAAASLTITNCILWNDAPTEIGGGGADATVTYSDVRGGWPGEGNIDADPLFVDPDGPDDDPNTWADNDYHLAAGSPCINAGDPGFVADPNAVDIDGEPRVQQCRVDMGADETPYFNNDCNGNGVADVCDVLLGGLPDINGDLVPDECQVGDMNCDGTVGFGDINPFVQALLDPVQYALEQPGCSVTFADINGDGAVTFADINPFVDLLLGT